MKLRARGATVLPGRHVAVTAEIHLSVSVAATVKRRVLIAEHDADTAELVRDALGRERGIDARITTTGAGALETALQEPLDLVVLDAELPDPDGLAVCRTLRARRRTTRVPIVLLSERAADRDRIRGLRTGADDYLAKPFNVEELQLRVRGILRRIPPEPPIATDVFELGNLRADFDGVSVEVNGGAVTLTRRELELLRYLVEHRNRVLTHRRLVREVWFGVDLADGTRTLAVHIARLRSKLGIAGAHIETVPGHGYRFNVR